MSGTVPFSKNDRALAAAPALAQQHGVLVLNKPKGVSSAACTGLIKRRLGQKKIGHGGTLDPMATGVLLVLLGQATKLSGHLMDQGDKIYSGEIALGVITDTWDAEGQVLESHSYAHVDEKALAAALPGLTGTYEQEVPAYSAAKHEGRPLYKLARKGIDAPVKTKLVTVSRCEAELVGPGRIRFRVTCGSGTYIRSLAHSLGKRLGCGGMLTELTREYSHPFGIAQAHALDDVLGDPEAFALRIAGIAEALPAWPTITLDAENALRVKNGTRLDYATAALPDRDFCPGLRALMLDADKKALALAEAALDGARPAWTVTRGLWNP